MKNKKAFRLNNMILNNEWVKNEIKEEIKRYCGTNENKNTTTRNLRATTKVVLRKNSHSYMPTSRNKKDLK